MEMGMAHGRDGSAFTRTGTGTKTRKRDSGVKDKGEVQAKDQDPTPSHTTLRFPLEGCY